MKEVIDKLAKDLNIPSDVILKVYKSYWKSIKAMISEVPLKEDMDQLTFNKLKKNVNITKIGKLYCSYEQYKKVREDAKHKENKIDSQLHSCDKG